MYSIEAYELTYTGRYTVSISADYRTIPLSRSGYSQSPRIHQRQNLVPERLLGPVSEEIEKLSLGQAALQAITSISFL